ncbi:hypothetical protein MTX26_06075 [Bradyrhizobium sp. ISRA443]|uniref:hypothetical protein n=1 Tax=unclassified Bradyrhizobium TaxID=2631580 RepID=UPI0024796928|nr:MULTISPECIES: hypothetical protein [unclassified Bradyrhizobium]WGR95405.1 hypothetical protein MTX20_16265 [Bradyrhizobium sp. ISRA435]WGS00413.1 hypothetical protein MTX23_06075 [Bradyrhizobium sp. ISRA436]WGS07303.1 hypothetical protein MTX18_06075 [Bradyrhizobium sp. ISRA437]WGS14187.1 hypothetical protein MTX26_06075 [Bradyrhizobium sp. ISRA443]
MNKRPKSREETPKEGSDSARRYRTATICDRAAQNARLFETFPALSHGGWRICNSRPSDNFLFEIKMLLKIDLSVQRYAHSLYTRTRNFVIGAGTVELSKSKPIRKLRTTSSGWDNVPLIVRGALD